MPQEAEALLRAEVEPFPLTADILHLCFQLQITTIPRIPSGPDLLLRDAWIEEVVSVTQRPRDVGRWVRLLVFWICVLPTYQPTCACERRELTRNSCQRRQIEHFLKVWHEPSGIFRLLTYVLEHPPTYTHERRRPRHDPQTRRSRRLVGLGRYRDAVAALSQAPPAVPSESTLAQLK